MKNSWAEGAVRQPFPGRIQSPFSSDEKLTDFDDASSYNNFYEFGTRKSDPKEHAQAFVPRPWSVVVDGACAKPGTYDLEDFLRPHTLEERIYRLRCVEAWSMVIPWVGFSLGDALKRFQPTSRAKYVAFYTCTIRNVCPAEAAGIGVALPGRTAHGRGDASAGDTGRRYVRC